MAWKRKEKKLTPDEAVALAKKELKPFWFGSDPLFAAVKNGDVVSVHPLSAQFSKKPWIMIFVDPTEFVGYIAIELGRIWNKRYSAHGLGFLGILAPRYSFLKDPALVRLMIEREKLTYPFVLDSEQYIASAFGTAKYGKIFLFEKGKTIFSHSFNEWETKTEDKIQDFLRDRDQGLPLLPIFQGDKKYQIARNPVEFGAGRGAPFPPPGFKTGKGGFFIGEFSGSRPVKLKEREMFMQGNWIQDGERIATSDPSAVIALHPHAKHFSIVAQSLSRTNDIAKMVVEINGKPAFDTFAGENLTLSDDGEAVVKIKAGDLYHVLRDLPETEREVTLTFPRADRSPIAIYGLRFSD